MGLLSLEPRALTDRPREDGWSLRGTWEFPVLTLGHCGGGLGSDHFLNQKDGAGGKRHDLGRLQSSQLPGVGGVHPPPQGGSGNPWIRFPGVARACQLAAMCLSQPAGRRFPGGPSSILI